MFQVHLDPANPQSFNSSLSIISDIATNLGSGTQKLANVLGSGPASCFKLFLKIGLLWKTSSTL